ncbi:UDP-glucose 6-dehydrogenase [Deinococcus aquiradiocola]|uniref:UDP-glucose 6-dehydrogenase n=1 Tax=Deinococcus aquiradiocola TaxID=393059 RepID=A0A917PGZ5_9DEIO|nr:UDP-glucose/GDP-mannose dehydrogenase family protein [Deinococcus aquiradiocola]GGJ78195.1 UDP-glucose 6-dehydrogenase [Deinococcus aquiradiocola]
MLNVTVVGTGYVGLGTAIMLAQLGHQVTGLDVDARKIDQLNLGHLPIYEPGLDVMLAENAERLTWTSDYTSAIPHADVIFICVGTPSLPDGRPNLGYVESAARHIAANLNGKVQVIVNKSTVPIGTGDWVTRIIEDATDPQHHNRYFVVSNPEFLREGTAVSDSLYPDRIVLGGDSVALQRMRDLYAPLIHQNFTAPGHSPRPAEYTVPAVVETTLTSAEMIKYAANAFLALKISYANEIAGLCERVGANIDEVVSGVGFDGRIGHRFLAAGAGWGGSCFGKDTSALITTGQEYGYDMPILQAAIDINSRQRDIVLEKLRKHLRLLKGKRVAVLGMAFKPNTDDLRDAPAHDFIQRLTQLGATVIAHDPVAMPRARHEWAYLSYQEAPSAHAAVRQADAVIISTEWSEYRALDWDALALSMRTPIIIDARNVISDPLTVHATIEQIGKELPKPLAVSLGVTA